VHKNATDSEKENEEAGLCEVAESDDEMARHRRHSRSVEQVLLSSPGLLVAGRKVKL